MRQLLQIVLCGVDDAALLAAMHAGSRATVGLACAQAHLNKNKRAIGRAHNRINLSPAPAGRFVIARQQRQALLLQPGDGCYLSGIAHRLACTGRALGSACCWVARGEPLIDAMKETHW